MPSGSPAPAASARPPSPTGSVVSVASSTMSVTTVGGTKKRIKKRPPSPTESVVSRFDNPDVTVEEAMEFVSTPHFSWDSALKEMARREAKGIKDDDNMSTTSTVSAYSMASTRSNASRKGKLGTLPPSTPKSSPPPQPDFTVGGKSVGGSSFTFKQPPPAKQPAAAAGNKQPTPAPKVGPRTPSIAKKNGSETPKGRSTNNVGGAQGLSVGPPAGATGIRRGSGPKAPSSAPLEKGKRGQQQDNKVGPKPKSAAPDLTLHGGSGTTAFVPKMAPKRK